MIEKLLLTPILILAVPILVYVFIMGGITRVFARLKRRMAINSDSLKFIKTRYEKSVKAIRQPYHSTCKSHIKSMSGSKHFPSDSSPETFRQTSECDVARETEDKHMHMLGELDKLVDDYLTMPDSERRALRYILSNDFEALNRYHYSAIAMLKSTKNRIWLLRGLAAASLENCQCDLRDSIMALDRLIETAKSVGIDWREDVISVAQISDCAEPLGGGGGSQWRSTKDYFERRARDYD